MDVHFVIENGLWVAEVNGLQRIEIGDETASIQAIVDVLMERRPSLRYTVHPKVHPNPWLQRSLRTAESFHFPPPLREIDMCRAQRQPEVCGKCGRDSGWVNPAKGSPEALVMQCFHCEAVKSGDQWIKIAPRKGVKNDDPPF